MFNRQLNDVRDGTIITCLEYIREFLMKRIVVVQQLIEKNVGQLTPTVKAMFDAIKKKLLIVLLNGLKLLYIKYVCLARIGVLLTWIERSVVVGSES